MQPKLPTDASSLEQRKQALRALRLPCFPFSPKSSSVWKMPAGPARILTCWLSILANSSCPIERKIVAHGTDAAVVLAEAAQITGRPAEELPLVGVIDPLLDMPR